MAFWHRKKRPAAGAEPDLTRLPRHIGIIMDGNGRWAKKRGLPRTAGHAAGAETFRTIAYRCRDLGIPYLTVYAFSTENWKRPVEEVSAIMDLLRKYLLEALEKMEKDGFRIRFFGDLEALPPELRTLCLETEETGAAVAGAKYQINVCLNYGGRDEILRAARAWGRDVLAGRQGVEDLTDEVFSRYLDSRRAGPRPCHPAQRRAAAVQFPALAVGLRRVLFYRCALARFQSRGPGRGPGGLPAASAQIWRRIT